MPCDKMATIMRAVAYGVLLTLLAVPASQAQAVLWTSGAFTYDGSGNVTFTGTDAYVYDSLSRLVTATADRQRTGAVNQQSYTYDPYGNRLTVTTSGTGCVGACAPSVLADINNHVTNHGASYDAAGNLKTFDTFTYAYDGSGMLTRQSVPGGIDWQYIYTADDERVATYTGQGNWRFTLRDLDGKVLREVTAWQNGGATTWTRVADHVYRDGLLLATVEAGGATEQFHLDHLGTPRMVTSASGAVVGIHTYYAFGDELALSANESPLERLKFTGHERDINDLNGNSLDYMHARYYSANMARFLSVDPVEGNPQTPQSWNRYVYVKNNPVGSVDPDGRCDAAIAAVGSAACVGQNAVNGVIQDYRDTKEAISGMGLHASLAENMMGYQVLTLMSAKYAVAFLPVSGPNEAAVAELAAEVTETTAAPELIYRGGGKNPGNLTPRALVNGMLSTRDSISNPYPLQPGQKPPLPAGQPIQAIATSKLPAGTVVRDGVPYGPQPQGHVSVGPNVSATTVKDAIIDTIKPPKD